MKNVSPCISVLPEGGLPFLFSTVYHVSFSTYLCDYLFSTLQAISAIFLLIYFPFFAFLLISSYFSDFVFVSVLSCFLVIAVSAFFALRMGFPGRIDSLAVSVQLQLLSDMDIDETRQRHKYCDNNVRYERYCMNGSRNSR